MFGCRGQKARVSIITLSNMKLKKWMNVTLDSLPKFAKVNVVCHYAAQPNCDSSLLNSSPALLWLSGDKKLLALAFFNETAIKQQLNTGGSLPVLQ